MKLAALVLIGAVLPAADAFVVTPGRTRSMPSRPLCILAAPRYTPLKLLTAPRHTPLNPLSPHPS